MKIIKLLTSTLLVISLLATTILTAIPTFAADAVRTYNGAPIQEHTGGYDYDYIERTLVTHTFDFSVDRINGYANEPALHLGNRACAQIVDGALTTQDGKDFVFGSAIFLGDDYGLEQGYLIFDLSLNAGNTYLGVRTSHTGAVHTDRGIWFDFDGSSTLRIFEPECGLEATVSLPAGTSNVQTFTLHEALDTIALYQGEQLVALIEYSPSGHLAILDANGATLASTEECELYAAGYFSFELCDIDGYLDNVRFTHVQKTAHIPETDILRTIDYSTWTATDALDRTLADNAIAGAPNEQRYVGLFYFLCWVGAGQVVQDNTKLYLELGYKKAKAYIEENGGEAYWAEPYFGYYRNTDTWVYRKHAYMLEQAGVDFIFLDVSNAEVFISGHTALFDTWLSMRHQGIDTPQIVFFNGDTPATFQSNMTTLFTTVYSDENWEKYQELFFLWEGKPLVFGNYSGLSGQIKQKVDEKFTVRGSWAWVDQDNYWAWLQEYTYDTSSGTAAMQNGGWGRDAQGNIESLSIAMGHHPAASKGRSFVNGRQPSTSNMGFKDVEQAGLGLGFTSQFNAMQKLVGDNVKEDQPFVLMITGWNEWIAGCSHIDAPGTMAGTNATFQYIDQFNCEFSRDGEPMRNQDGYGIGDNYYYQMVDQIRRYKGIDETPVADDQTSIDIYDLSSWDAIDLAYMDSLYDIEHRNSISYNPHYRYVNNTGRNDFDYAKISQDEHNLYFLVKTSSDIIIDNNSTWMNLYLNVDGDASTGWEGYDYVLNRDRDSFVVTVEKFKDNSFESEVVGGAYYYLEGSYMAIRLSKQVIGIKGKLDDMIFKWADNSTDNGDPMAFMDLGDTAPDNRFGFVYKCESYQNKVIPKTDLVYDPTTITQNGSVIPKPEGNADITLKEVIVDTLYDLSDVKPGVFVDKTAIGEHFEHAAGTSASTVQVVKGEKFNYLRMKECSDLRTWNDVEGKYEFAADVHMVDYGNSAIYIRGEMPGAYTPTNPKNFNVKQVFNYFEWDWYAENGGHTYGGSSSAGSGIGIYPDQNRITIRIKRYAPDGLGVASASYSFPYSGKFTPDADGWFKLRVVDDEKTVSIYMNDALMCTVKLENPGVVYEGDGTGQQYYGKATLCDADGKEVLAVENTRLNSQGSQIALTTRFQTMEFANLYIAYTTQVAEGGKVESALTESTEQVSYTPDTRLLTTLSTGTAPEDETQATESETQEPEQSEQQSSTGAATQAPEQDAGCKSMATASTVFTVLFALMACTFACKKKES